MKKILIGVVSFNFRGTVDNNKKDAGRSVSTKFCQPITS
jgi:hypothetical protein